MYKYGDKVKVVKTVYQMGKIIVKKGEIGYVVKNQQSKNDDVVIHLTLTKNPKWRLIDRVVSPDAIKKMNIDDKQYNEMIHRLWETGLYG